MNIFRIKNPEFFDLVKEQIHNQSFEGPDGIPYHEYMKVLYNEFEDNFFILGVTNEDDEDLIGFTIATITDYASFAFFEYVYFSQELPEKTRKTMIDLNYEWARRKGKKAFRATVERSPKAFNRRWGYTPINTVITKDI